MKTKEVLNLNRSNDRIILGIYIFWIVINLVFLIVGFTTGSEFYHKGFFPFTGYLGSQIGLNSYDGSEFLFYAIVPVLIFVGLKLISPLANDQKDSSDESSSKVE